MRGRRMLERGRKRAAERFSETVTVGRWENVRLPGELEPVSTLVETYFTGVAPNARVKYPSAAATVKSPAGQQIAETRIVVSLPSGTVSIPTGAFVRVDASTSDETLVGRMFRVDGPAQAGQTTAHRYPVVEES